MSALPMIGAIACADDDPVESENRELRAQIHNLTTSCEALADDNDGLRDVVEALVHYLALHDPGWFEHMEPDDQELWEDVAPLGVDGDPEDE